MGLLNDAITWWLGHIDHDTIQEEIVDPINAALDQSDWTNLTIDSGFTTAGTQAPQYMTDGPRVYFRGKVKPSSGTFATGTAFTGILSGLPTAAQPAVARNFMCTSSGGVFTSGNWSVNTDGTIDLITGGNVPPSAASGYDLSSITYPAGT